MTLFTTLYDNLKDNERIKDLGFAILGGTISILGTRLLTGVKETQETDENYEDEIEDD
mgnify:FL=1|jgi:hypothetical protein|tara:strand:- start:32 stop:205 length:174 start_codon:yes stop_codon:yes gene_type:complete